jgi:hypothetical protein
MNGPVSGNDYILEVPEVLNSSHEALFKLYLWLPAELSSCSSDVWSPLFRIIFRQWLMYYTTTATRQLCMCVDSV